MKRIRELVAEVRRRHPSDDFFTNFEESCKTNHLKKSLYRTYNSALMTLDEQSWHTLRQKACDHYLNHRHGQLKQGFFNQLNEAFAYRFLSRKGFANIQFIPEDKKTTPDIGFVDGERQRYCEVKTLGLSEDEITRRATARFIDGSVYRQLSDEFLQKLESSLNQARTQIRSHGNSGLAFLVVRFDDLALDYYANYRRQLLAFLAKHGREDIYIKIGIHGHRRLFRTGSAQSDR